MTIAMVKNMLDWCHIEVEVDPEKKMCHKLREERKKIREKANICWSAFISILKHLFSSSHLLVFPIFLTHLLIRVCAVSCAWVRFWMDVTADTKCGGWDAETRYSCKVYFNDTIAESILIPWFRMMAFLVSWLLFNSFAFLKSFQTIFTI